MPAAAIDRRLGHTRVDFAELVQLRSSLAQTELWSRATNLSEGGIHVRTDAVLAPGTLMDLVLPLPRAEQSLEVKGRVAWSRVERDPGMGIELVDLSETELSYLRREVMEGRPREWRREVKVWFEGTREPTRAIATGAGANLQLVSELGFLKLGSQLVVYGGAQASPILGTLSEVALRRSGDVPQLVLSVLPAESDSPPPPDQTWTHWPPAPVRAITEETDAIIIEEAPVCAPEVHMLELDRELAVSGSILAHARPEPVLSPEPSVQTAPRCEAPTDSGRPPNWQLGPVSESSDWQLRSPALTQELPRVRRRRAWLWWLAAALMAGTTAASMSYTDSWIRVREKLLGWWGGLGQRLTPTSTGFSLMPPSSSRSLVTPEPIRLPVTPPPQEPEAAPAAKGPLVEVTARRISIPIRGSIRGSRSYPLAEPTGIAVNLPHASSLVGFGDFEIQQAGFRTVWVRRRGDGLHLRVFFAESYTPTLSVAAERVSVQLRSEATTPTP